jgi:kumamolisin
MQMEMVFALRNANNFYACLASINDPTSPNYGRYLNLTELQPYLPTPGDKLSIIAHLTHRGFTVADGASPLVLRISANVRTVEATFGVNVNQYSLGNFSFYGVGTDPSLPQNFAPMIDGITGLTNYTAIAPAESPCSGPYCPQGIQTGYSFTGLYSSGDNGGGEKVAIVDVPGDPNIQTALNTFDSQYGLASTTLNIIYPDGVPSAYDPAWASETAMDVEAVHTAAPGAGIVLLYDTSDLMNAVDYVASNHLATIVTNSWGYVCGSGSPCSDTELPSSTVSSVDSRLALDAAQGLTILFASGDEGATPDGGNFGIEFPASDPNVLAVGATDLLLSGCSTTTCSGYGSESGATISGGGYSGYFPESSWQTSNIGVKSGRAVPDVSMIGGVDPVGGVGFWVYSTASDKCTPDDTNYGAGWFGCAGTSLATPLWAGFIAVASQVKGGNFGNIDPLLYQLASSGSYSSIFHDVTSGSNGYPAGKGWDPVTGWGSPIANSLATALAQKQQGTIQVTTDKTTYTQGDTIHYTGSGFTVLGSIQACLSTDNDGSLLCVNPEPNADQNGNVAGTMVVGTNIPAGPQKFYVEDISTAKFSSPVQLTIQTPAAITFYTNPSTFAGASSPGSISACSGTFTNGQSSANCSSSFSATANLPSPSSGYTFSGWSTTGGLSVASSSNPITTVTITGAGTITATFTQLNQSRVSLSTISGFTRNASGQILFVVGDLATNPHGSKPAGVGYQAGRDTTPLGFLCGMLTNSQPTVFDTNTGYVASNGRPTTSIPLLFVIGGGDVNAVANYYETTTVAEQAPLTVTQVGSNYVWTNRAGTQVASVPTSSVAIPPGNSDVFVIQILQDTSDRTVVLLSGTTYLGTWAAAWYLKNVIYPNISTYTHSYYVVQWTDANGDFTPDGGDTYTILAQGP